MLLLKRFKCGTAVSAATVAVTAVGLLVTGCQTTTEKHKQNLGTPADAEKALSKLPPDCHMRAPIRGIADASIEQIPIDPSMDTKMTNYLVLQTGSEQLRGVSCSCSDAFNMAYISEKDARDFPRRGLAHLGWEIKRVSYQSENERKIVFFDADIKMRELVTAKGVMYFEGRCTQTIFTGTTKVNGDKNEKFLSTIYDIKPPSQTRPAPAAETPPTIPVASSKAPASQAHSKVPTVQASTAKPPSGKEPPSEGKIEAMKDLLNRMKMAPVE